MILNKLFFLLKNLEVNESNYFMITLFPDLKKNLIHINYFILILQSLIVINIRYKNQ